MNIKTKFKLPTRNGTLTDSDFVGDTPRIGSADAKYSTEDLAELDKLADELKAQQSKGKKK
jgi:hypothetical protein